MTNPKVETAGERRFRQVVEAAPSAMVMIDRAGMIVMVNTQAERVFGAADRRKSRQRRYCAL